MKLMSIFNDKVADDLNLSLEDLYILGYFYKLSNTTSDTKIINNSECFSINLVDIFINRPLLFEKVLDSGEDKELTKKIYEKNRKKLDRILKGNLSKCIIKTGTIKSKEGSKNYYKLNKTTIKVLVDGYPVKRIREFTEIEKYIMKELKLNELSNSIVKQLEKMELDILKNAVEVAKLDNILDYPYVRAIYNNLMLNKKADNAGDITDFNENTTNQIENYNNSISKNKNNYNNNSMTQLNPKLHNYMGSANFMKYTPEELEKMIKLSQKDKFK